MSQELIDYLFLHREFINILNTVFCGYKDSKDFLPPEDELIDAFNTLRHEYLNLDVKPEMQNLPLITLRQFRSLTDSFKRNIDFWNKSRQSIDDDLDYIKRLLPNDLTVSDNLKLIQYELDPALKDHQIQKDKLFKTNDKLISINDKQSTLIVNGKIYEIEIKSKPFQFLKVLLNNKGNVVEYIELAKILQINSYAPNKSSKDIKREIQDIKDTLLTKIGEIGVPEKLIKKISNKIISKTNFGYKFSISD